MAEQVVVELTVDAKGATTGVAQFNTALDSAHAKAEKVQQSTMKMLVGVPQSADRVSDALKKLQASLDPVTKAQFQMEREMTRSMSLIERAVRTGVTTEQQAANTIAAIRQKQIRDLDAVRAAQLRMVQQAANQNQNQGGLARFGSLNATSQFQDIAITAAMGQSPLTIALQQGTQLGMALEAQLGDQGAKGLVKGLGSALMGLVSPINLIAIGLTGVAALAIQYFMSASKDAEKLEKALKDQKKAIEDVAASYGLAELKSQDFYRKSTLAAEAAARVENKAARERLQAEQVAAIKALIPGVAALGGGIFGSSTPDSPMARMIETSVIALQAAQPDFAKLEQNLKGMVSQNPELQGLADQILKIADAAHELASQLSLADKVVKDISRSSVGGLGSVGRLREQGQGQTELMRRMHPEMFPEPRNLVQEEIDARRRNESAWADMQRMIAKSPQEISAAVRRQEEAKVISGESNIERSDRIRIESTKALAQAEYQLIEAHKQRARALEETLASSRLDLELIGKTIGEQAALRMEFEKTQELRQHAAENNIAVDQKELDLIKQKAVEYGKLAEAIQKTSLLRDIQFERDQLTRSPGEQQIASRLRGTGLGLDSDVAAELRYNQQFAEVRDGVRSFLDDIGDALVNGGDDIGKALAQAILGGLNKILDKMLDQVLNSLANSIASALMGGGPGQGILSGGAGGVASFGTAGGFMTMLQTAGGFGKVPDNVGAGGAGSIIGKMSQYAQAIKDIESGGNYSALGPITRTGDRAYGAYQIMGNNVPSWSEKWLGQRMTGPQLLGNQGAQDKIFAGQFGSYVDKWGNPQDAASAWHSGRPLSQAGGAMDQLGTRTTDYVEKFNTAVGRATETTAVATKDIGSLGNAGASATQGLGQLGNALAQFPAAPASFGGGAFGAGGGGLASLFGGGGGPSFTPWEMSYFPTHAGLWAKGGAFHHGNVIPFARGGVVSQPTLFPMANGAGLMGEAGPEAVMPLRRGANGNLGVAMHGGGARVVVNNTIINQAGVDVASQRRDRPDGGVDLVTTIRRVVADDMSRPGTVTDKALNARNARPALKRFG